MNTSKCRLDGFSLIELAIVLIVTGLLMSGVFQIMTIHIQSKHRIVTLENLKNSETALKRFFQVNGRYPCPAGRFLQKNDSQFGRQDLGCLTSKHLTASASAGSAETNAPTLAVPGRNGIPVQIGILPFRSLGMPDSKAIDGWGRLIQYAVTEQLTDFSTYDPRQGAIDVLAEDLKSRLTPPGTAQYVIVSTGENGKGGFSQQGIPIDQCPVDALESYNCNGKADFMDTTFQIAHKMDYDGRRTTPDILYDDYIAYQQYDIEEKNGLVFLYYNKCMPGFYPVNVPGRNVVDIETLENDFVDEIDNSAPRGELKLCFSSHYSAAFKIQIVDGKKTALCPAGWQSIGYKIFGSGLNVTNYQVCAR